MPFEKYEGVLDLLNQSGVSLNTQKSLAGNANLKSDLLKSEMISVIGEQQWSGVGHPLYSLTFKIQLCFQGIKFCSQSKMLSEHL